MDTAAFHIKVVTIIFLLIVIVSLLIYVLPLIFVRRFHTGANVLLIGVGLNGIICSILWVIWNSISISDPTLLVKSRGICVTMNFLPTFVNSLIIYCLVVITINQFFAVIYPNKRFVRSVKCAILSLMIQWAVSIMVSIPDVIISVQVNLNNLENASFVFLLINFRFV